MEKKISLELGGSWDSGGGVDFAYPAYSIATTLVARLTRRQLHVRARISTISLFSVTQPVWSNYQNCYY